MLCGKADQLDSCLRIAQVICLAKTRFLRSMEEPHFTRCMQEASSSELRYPDAESAHQILFKFKHRDATNSRCNQPANGICTACTGVVSGAELVADMGVSSRDHTQPHGCHESLPMSTQGSEAH